MYFNVIAGGAAAVRRPNDSGGGATGFSMLRRRRRRRRRLHVKPKRVPLTRLGIRSRRIQRFEADLEIPRLHIIKRSSSSASPGD
jgi:hypothetical protein